MLEYYIDICNQKIQKMKKGLALLISIFIINGVWAQKCDIVTPTPPDTSQVTLYGGLTGSGFIAVKNNELAKYANLRVGAIFKKKFSKQFSFHGWIGYEPGEHTVLVRGSLKYSGSKVGISAGYQPTPVSQIRPKVFSVDGQAEYTAEIMVPGGALGTSFWYKEYTGGIYVRNGKPEYQLAYLGEVLSAGIWTTADKFGGATLRVDIPKEIYVMFTANNENQQGVSLGLQPVRRLPYKLLWDFAQKDARVIANMVGIQYYFSLKKFTAARANILYDFITKSAGVMFLVSIEHKE